MDLYSFMCCPECGSTDFTEIPAVTSWGRDYLLRCDNDDCEWIRP